MKKLLYILLFVPLALFGQDNYSLSFDGEDDWVAIGNHSLYDIDDEMTISLWMKANEYQTTTVISRQPDIYGTNNGSGDMGYQIALRSFLGTGDDVEGQIWSVLGNSFPTNTVAKSPNYSYLPNEWIHITGVWKNNSYIKLLVNGNIIDSVSTNLSFNTDVPLEFGRNNYGNFVGHYFHGIINQVSIWNRALTEAEILFNFNCLLPQNESGLIGLWNFNEGSGDTVYDISGNGNHGIINGATYSDDVPEQNCDDSSLNEPSIIEQLNQSFDAWNVSIDLSAGWNMFGYGCPTSIGVADGLSNHTESIIITKDNSGNVYMPEFGFNGIGDFAPGFGYQIKLTEAIEGFSLCDWYVNDIPEDNIVSLQEEVENLQAELDSIYGCIDESACNYDETASLNDGSCDYSQQGYDCDGNITEYVVGMEAEGGIIFYIDETGQHGLVAAMEDLTEGATIDSEGNPGYQWGCFATWLSGADGQAIGTGYQNTLDIVAGCSETPIAASEALAYELGGYSDWYLPSLDELNEMYNTIGSEGNIGGFSSNWYWSSSESNNYGAYDVNFGDGSTGNFSSKTKIVRVRVIRSF